MAPARTRRRALLLALLCVVSRCAAAATQLLLAFAVTRHGSRNALVKTPQLVEPGGGVTLLPAGQRQCYNAGAAFRARYLDAASCAAGGGAGGAPTDTCWLSGRSGGGGGAPLYGLVTAANVSWSNFNLLARSSALDRTILSARSFLEGDRCSAALQAGKCVRADPSRCACPFRRWPQVLSRQPTCLPPLRTCRPARSQCQCTLPPAPMRTTRSCARTQSALPTSTASTHGAAPLGAFVAAGTLPQLE